MNELGPILLVKGMDDETTPIIEFVTTCSKCRETISTTQFDSRHSMPTLDVLASLYASADADKFIAHAKEVHGVAKKELDPPVVVVEV